MAGDIPPILIDVQVQMGKVKSQLDELQSEIKQIGDAAKKQESSVGGLEKSLGKLAGGFKKILGAAAVGAVLTESAKAAAEDAQSMALLNNQLDITVGANAAQKQAVDDAIQSMSDASGIVDDKIRPAFSGLVRATKDVAAAQSLTTLALDASAAKGVDLETVSNALAKAHNGNTKQLAMLFPELKNSKDMMGDLAAETKGMAEQAANANPMGKLGVQLDRMKESLGQALIPLLNQLAPVFKQLQPVINVVAQVVGKLIQKLMPLVQVIIDELVPVIEYLLDALWPVVDAILDAVMPAFKAIVKIIKPIIEKILPPLIKLLDKVLVPILSFLAQLIADYVVPWIGKLADVLGNVLGVAVDLLVKGFQNAMAVLGPFWENVLKPLVDGFMAMMGIKAEPEVKVKVDDSETSKLAKLDYTGFGNFNTVAGSGAGGTGKSPQAKAAEEQAKAIKKAQDDFQKATKKAQDEYQKDILERVKNFKKSFEDATKVNVADLFNMGYQSGASMIEALKEKLTYVKNFATDIAKLSASNYSEEFITQIESLGPMVGGMFAEQLLSETPDVQDQLKSLFSESQLVSQTGVDAVAKNLIPTFTDATTRLGNAMVDAANQLATALGNIKTLTPDKVQTTATSTIKGTSSGTTATGKTAPSIVVNTNVSNTGASAKEIASSTVSAIKFNLPYVIQDVNQLTQNLANQTMNNIQAEWSSPNNFLGGNF